MTLGAIRGLRFQTDLIEKNGLDAVSVVQEHAAKIASTGADTMHFSSYSLGYSQSNISWKDIDDIFSSFNIKGGKNTLDTLVARFGSGLYPPSEFFSTLSRRRHDAAHNASANIEASDLTNTPSPLLSFCIAIDALLNAAVKRFVARDVRFLGGDKAQRICDADITLRFLEQDESGLWREKRPGLSRAVAVSATLEMARGKIMKRKKRGSNEICIARNHKGEIVEWFF